jgi:O-methyltransferase involved in polyketide biosynthesis
MSSSDTSCDEMTIGTATEALLSKLSASQKGYFEDEFLPHLVGGKTAQKKPPIINRGYFARVACISKVLAEFNGKCIPEGVASQVLVLGGGYDTIALNLLKGSERRDLRIFEIDFPEIINRKASIISSNPYILSIVQGSEDGKGRNSDISATSSSAASSLVKELGNLTLIAADLRDSVKVLELLTQSSFNSSLPTFVVSECVLVYMSMADVQMLVQR